MNRQRTESGASILALSAVCISILVLLGIGIYRLVFLIGSQKSLQDTTDAATVNVAKLALSGVYANLDVGANPSNYLDASMTPLLGTQNLNVYGYNRAIARAAMVALNALDMQAGDATPIGVDLSQNGAIANANALIDRLQNGPNSIGGQLQRYLTTGMDAEGNMWAQQAFNQIASSPLSSLGLVSGVQFDNTQYTAAYFTGTGETTALAPTSDQIGLNSSLSSSSVSSSQVLMGYGQGIHISGGTAGSLDVVGVPADPLQSPHLISLQNFSDPNQNWVSNGAFVPPNAFKVGAQVVNQKTQTTTRAQAAALMGGLPSIQGASAMFAQAAQENLIPQLKRLIAYLGTQPAYAQSSATISAATASIPGGYILIDNTNANATNSVSGSLSATDNVFSNELGVGISVDDTTSLFSNNGAVQNWQSYPHTPPAKGTPWNPQADPLADIHKIPSVTGLFNPDGSAATQAQAGAIPYSSDPNNPPPTSLCTDQNSDAADPNSDLECVRLASPTSTGGLDPFDVAYHPNASPGNPNISTPAVSLTASEVAKLCIIAAFSNYWANPGLPQTLPIATIHPTGIRLWPGNTTPDNQNDPDWPYSTGPAFGFQEYLVNSALGWSDPAVSGKISHDGTVYSLFHQIDPSDTGYKNFLSVSATRVMQMGAVGKSKSDITAQVDSLYRTVNVPIGTRKYLYLNQQTDATTGKQTVVLSLDDKGPDWLVGSRVTSASMALQQDLLSNLDILQNTAANQWNLPGSLHPSGSTTGAVQLDGVWTIAASHSFNAVNSIINPPHEWNVHDQLFTQNGNSPSPGQSTTGAQITTTETAAYQKTSGAYGLLGVLKFQESLADRGSYFWAAN